MRSSWKGSFLKRFNLLEEEEFKLININSSIINNSYIGCRVLIHLGNKIKSFKISQIMLGFRFGEFLICKKLGKIIHYKKLGKKKKRK